MLEIPKPSPLNRMGIKGIIEYVRPTRAETTIRILQSLKEEPEDIEEAKKYAKQLIDKQESDSTKTLKKDVSDIRCILDDMQQTLGDTLRELKSVKKAIIQQ